MCWFQFFLTTFNIFTYKNSNNNSSDSGCIYKNITNIYNDSNLSIIMVVLLFKSSNNSISLYHNDTSYKNLNSNKGGPLTI
jgi:hypothetical protein